jgi:hypothetical protein
MKQDPQQLSLDSLTLSFRHYQEISPLHWPDTVERTHNATADYVRPSRDKFSGCKSGAVYGSLHDKAGATLLAVIQIALIRIFLRSIEPEAR